MAQDLDMDSMLKLACDAARVAGNALVKRDSGWTDVTQESAKDIKIAGDQHAENIILDILASRSEIPVLSEEKGWTGDESSALNWVVDPLDGTANYHQGMPLCCVSIALMNGWEPVLGVVYDFNRDEMFSGVCGQRAWLNGEPMSVSEIKTPDQAILNTGFPANRDFSEQALSAFAREAARWRKVRMLGTAALSLAYVACGRSDAYEENDVMLWDVAAGCALVRAAGGDVKISGEDMNKPVDVIATNVDLIRNLMTARGAA